MKKVWMILGSNQINSWSWGDKSSSPTLNHNDNPFVNGIHFVSNTDSNGNVLDSNGNTLLYNNGSVTLPVRIVKKDNGIKDTNLNSAFSINNQYFNTYPFYNGNYPLIFTQSNRPLCDKYYVSGSDDYCIGGNAKEFLAIPAALDENPVNGTHFEVDINHFSKKLNTNFDYHCFGYRLLTVTISGNNHSKRYICGFAAIDYSNISFEARIMGTNKYGNLIIGMYGYPGLSITNNPIFPSGSSTNAHILTPGDIVIMEISRTYEATLVYDSNFVLKAVNSNILTNLWAQKNDANKSILPIVTIQANYNYIPNQISDFYISSEFQL